MNGFAIAFIREFILKADEFCFCQESELEFITEEINRVLHFCNRSGISYEETARILRFCDIEEKTDGNTIKKYSKDSLIVPARYYKVDKVRMRYIYLATRKLPHNISHEKAQEVKAIWSRLLSWRDSLSWQKSYTPSISLYTKLPWWLNALVTNDRGDALLKWYQFIPSVLYIGFLLYIILRGFNSSVETTYWRMVGFVLLPISIMILVTIYGRIKARKQSWGDREDYQILQKYALFILHPRIAESLCAYLYLVFYLNIPLVIIMLLGCLWAYNEGSSPAVFLLPLIIFILPFFYFRILGPSKFWRAAIRISSGSSWKAQEEQEQLFRITQLPSPVWRSSYHNRI